MVQTANVVTLKPKTIQAFDEYITDVEEGMQGALTGRGAFLWCDQNPDRAQRIRQGQIVAQLWLGEWPLKVPNGLIHDWVGGMLVRSVTVEQVLSTIQSYDRHKNIYQPEVSDSRLLQREGNNFKIFLRLLKKKIITVVLDTEHDVRYLQVQPRRWFCQSRTTRITEVEDAGTAKERVLDPDTGYGFLWRLYSYWKFDERSEGVVVECRAISLTRDIPTGLGWIIEPIVRKLPEESLIATLEATRRALIG